MAIAKGSKSAIAWKPEVAFGVPPSGNWQFRPLTNETLDETINTIIAEDIRSDRATPSVRGGNIGSSGNLTHDFDLVSSLPWLRHLLASPLLAGVALVPDPISATTVYPRGSYFTSGTKTYIVIRGGTTHSSISSTSVDVVNTGGRQELQAASGSPLIIECIGTTAGLDLYTYELEAGIDMPVGGLSIEKQVKGGDDTLYVQYLGCRLNTLELTIPQEGIIKANWGVVSKSTRAVDAQTAGNRLTLGTVVDGDTVTIDGKVYTFQDTLTEADGNVKIGISTLNSLEHLRDAINLGTASGAAGVVYATAMTLHPTVTAVSVFTLSMVVAAKTAGTAGNSIATTTTSAGGSWLSATLTDGVAGTLSGTPTTLIRDPAVGFNALFDVNDPDFLGKTDGQALWREGSFSFSNRVQEDVYVIGDRFRADVPEGVRQVTGRLSLYFRDRTYYDIFKGETKVAIGLSFIVNGEFLRIELPEVKLTGNGTPKISGQGVLMQEFDYTAFLQDGDYDIKVTAVCKMASMES